MRKYLFTALVALNFVLVHAQMSPSCILTPSGTNISSGYPQPTSLTTNDFNSDGKFDLAVANNGGSGMVSVLMGNGNGTFISAVNYTVNGAKFIISDDFNNDGKIDLVSASTGSVSFFAGSGSGTFLSPIQYSVGGSIVSLTSADINGDGNIDLALVVGTGSISIMLGSGTGSFAPSVFYLAGLNPSSVSSADFNNDGQLDLVVTNASSNNISILLGSITGTLSPIVNYTVGSAPQSVVASDLNGDNIIDLAVTNSNSSNVSILIGLGSGNFSYYATHVVNNRLWAITSGDLNGDGLIDLITTNYNNSSNNNSVSVLLGIGAGNFSLSTEYITDYGSIAIVSKDFDNDGKKDLAVANNSSYNLTILKGASNGLASLPYYTIAGNSANLITDDFNNDGNADIASVMGYCSVYFGGGNGTISAIKTFTTLYNPTSLSSADFNNDGNKDIVMANISDHSFSIMLGTGLGTFSNTIDNFNTINPADIIPSDFNNDGNMDLAVLGSGQNAVQIFLGTGTGTFSLYTNFSTNCLPISITSGDFNLDGNVDLAAHTNCLGANVNILLGNGNGTFLAPITFSSTSSASTGVLICSKDLNSDGKLDLVTANSTGSSVGNSVSILLGTGTGSFTSTSNYTIGAAPNSLNIADLNEDNIPDIIVTNGGTLTVMYVSSTGSVASVSKLNPVLYSDLATIADFNNDGKNDFGVSNITQATIGITLLLNAVPSMSLSAQNMICLGSNVTISASGANTYSWNTGAATSNIIVSPTSNTSYSVTGTSSPGCSVSAVKTISVSTISPTISIIGTNTLCVNSSATFTSTGASNYTWSNGVLTSSIAVSPTITTNYSVVGTSSLGCSSSATVNLVVYNTCSDVWPGDANSDGTADNLDVLELGLHYTQTGAPRATTSNNWQSYFANNWTGTITSGKNLNHSDCNGDGTIDNNDTLAIYNNYSLTHTFKPAQTTTVNPQLSIVPDQPMVVKGNWGTASVYLGDATTIINNINGVAFTVDFDNTLIETNSIWIEYLPSFIDVSQNLHFRKLDFANEKLFTATTHTLNNNVSGFGKIAVLHYQILSSLTTDNVLNIGLSQANQSNASGSIVPLTSGTGTLMAIGASVGVKENLTGGLVISPNPTNGLLTISFNTVSQNVKLELYNSIGALVLSEPMNNKTNTINVSDLSRGIYFMKVLEGNKVIAVKKVVRE